MAELPQLEFELGAAVVKDSGDYSYRGRVVAAFHKLHGAPRYVVENADGILMIMAPHQLKRLERANTNVRPADAQRQEPQREYSGSLRGQRRR